MNDASTTIYNVTDFDYDDYYYMDEDSDVDLTYNMFEIILTVTVYSVTFFLGLIGNTLIIFATCTYRKMRSFTNILMSSLASSDLLLIIICIPLKLAKLFSYVWDAGEIICKGVHYMQNVSAICSVLTLTVISLERYYAVVHPMKAKYISTASQAKKIIIIIWILSVLLATPTLRVIIHLPVGINDTYRWCIKDIYNPSILRLHEVYMISLIFVIPFFIMTFSYVFICRELWKKIEIRSAMTNGKAKKRNVVEGGKSMETFVFRETEELEVTVKDDKNVHAVKQIIHMLVTVVVVFAICWLPLLIDNVLTAYELLPIVRLGALKNMSTGFSLMAYFNSCMNPIIYGFMSKNFRDNFFATCEFSLCLKNTPHTSNES